VGYHDTLFLRRQPACRPAQRRVILFVSSSMLVCQRPHERAEKLTVWTVEYPLHCFARHDMPQSSAYVQRASWWYHTLSSLAHIEQMFFRLILLCIRQMRPAC
jgi:hypothetical protein